MEKSLRENPEILKRAGEMVLRHDKQSAAAAIISPHGACHGDATGSSIASIFEACGMSGVLRRNAACHLGFLRFR